MMNEQDQQDNIIRIEEYRPHLVIPTDEAQHVYPVSYFEAIVRGDPVEPIPEDVLRVIVKEWLKDTMGAKKVRMNESKETEPNVLIRNLPWPRFVKNVLARGGITEIEQLKAEIAKGIRRGPIHSWFIAGKHLRKMGDSGWAQYILPYLDSIGFDWRQHYDGNIETIDRLIHKWHH